VDVAGLAVALLPNTRNTGSRCNIARADHDVAGLADRDPFRNTERGIMGFLQWEKRFWNTLPNTRNAGAFYEPFPT